jgi:predicted DNA-binding protein
VSDDKKTKIIKIRVSDTFKKKIESSAEKKKQDTAKFVRYAIEEKLEK